jgi:hypothetical protein
VSDDQANDQSPIHDSPELTGGAGFTYEDAVAAYYLVAMVGGTTAAGLAFREAQRVAQQQADFGEPLDDVIVDAVSAADGSVMRLSLQVKRSLTISDAATNADFREVIQRSWQTLQKPMFREHVDRVGAATGTVTEEAFRNFTTVCELARASDSTAVFMQRFSDGGNTSQAHRVVLNAVRKVAADGVGAPFSDDVLHRLFRRLTLIRSRADGKSRDRTQQSARPELLLIDARQLHTFGHKPLE